MRDGIVENPTAILHQAMQRAEQDAAVKCFHQMRDVLLLQSVQENALHLTVQTVDEILAQTQGLRVHSHAHLRIEECDAPGRR